MRTLTRPMFNMGGPIKQGVMHGIREPYKDGTRAALVGNPVYPRTGGREHHVVPLVAGGALIWPTIARLLGGQAIKKIGQTAVSATTKRLAQEAAARNVLSGGATKIAKDVAGAGAGGWKNIGKNWFSGDPTVKGAKWGWKTLTSPGASTLAQKTVKSIFSPTGIGLTAASIYFWPDGTKKTKEELAAQGIDQHGPFDHTKKKTKEASAAFAKSQREDRVNKYLDMMGYDRSKKLAIADALIDASKIVGERGTLDPKNITQELISPIIQATSKRLDKPQQIREAVGLMTMKAEIEKDLEDPSIKALRLEQLKGLRGGFSKDIGDFILSAKGTKVKPKALEQFARARANEHNLDFTVVTDEQISQVPEGATQDQVIQSVVTGDGVYMIGDAIVQVTGGVPKRIA